MIKENAIVRATVDGTKYEQEFLKISLENLEDANDFYGGAIERSTGKGTFSLINDANSGLESRMRLSVAKEISDAVKKSPDAVRTGAAQSLVQVGVYPDLQTALDSMPPLPPAGTPKYKVVKD